MPDLKLTKTQNEHFYYMADAMRRLEWDLHSTVFHHQRIPRDWHQIATQRESEKTRITLRVDRDVVKWFRSMGPGYQPRMNDVLRAFMHAKLAGLLKGDETLPAFRESDLEMEMPQWGDVARQFEGEDATT